MINDDEMLKIARALYEKTLDKKISWYFADDDEFRVSFLNSSVIIGETANGVYLQLRNSVGAVVGTVRSIELSLSNSDLLGKLFDIVKRRTLEIDETLADIWSVLDPEERK